MRKKSIGFALNALFFALCFPVEAQQTKRVLRIGFLHGANPSTISGRAEAFRQGLRELGYVEGKNVVIEYRYAEGKDDRLSGLAAELVRLKVDVIVTGAGPPTRAAKNATATIPIVMTVVGDPVGEGFVTSLARPGGNITGLTQFGPELSGKRLELLKEAVSRVTRVAVLWNPATTPSGTMREAEAAAQALALQLQSLEVRSPDDFKGAFEAAGKERAGALIVLPGPLTITHRTRIVDFAAKSRLPVMYPWKEFAEAGGLMSYSVNDAENYRRAATYVDKILKGAKPTDLPVEQPAKFEFVINLKAAKQIGLMIPPNVLAQADRIIK